MRRLAMAAAVLTASWFAVWLVPGAAAEAPEATGWWSAGRITPISQGIPTPNDVAPDAMPTYEGHGGTPLPQVPTVTTTPTTTPTLQIPSPVPEGGLYVAGMHVFVDGSTVPLEAIPDRTPTDPRIPFPTPSVETPTEVPQQTEDVDGGQTVFGVSALRLFVGHDAAVGDLTLEFDKARSPGGTETTAENKQGTVAVQACLPAVVWTPDEGGPIDSAPKADCSTGLAYGEDTGPSVRIPAGGLVRDGMLDVILMPQPGSMFQAVFKKPGPKSIEVTRYPSSEEGGGGGGGGGGEQFADLPVFPNVGCDCPLGDAPVLASVGSPGTFLLQSDPTPYEVRPPVAGVSRRFGGGGGGSPRLISDSAPQLTTWQKAMAGGILAVLVAFYLLLLRAPAGLAAVGPVAGRRSGEEAEAVRGIGRFARPRIGPNPRL